MEGGGKKGAVGPPSVILDPVKITASQFRRQTAIDMIGRPLLLSSGEMRRKSGLDQELRDMRREIPAAWIPNAGTIESRLETPVPEGPYRRGYDRGRRMWWPEEEGSLSETAILDGQNYRRRLYAGQAYGSVLRSVQEQDRTALWKKLWSWPSARGLCGEIGGRRDCGEEAGQVHSACI